MRIKTGLDEAQIRMNARLRCVWKRFPRGTPLGGTPLTIIPAHYHWGPKRRYLPNLYIRQIILGNSMCFMCTKKNF